jgi:ClpP class serine protease
MHYPNYFWQFYKKFFLTNYVGFLFAIALYGVAKTSRRLLAKKKLIESPQLIYEKKHECTILPMIHRNESRSVYQSIFSSKDVSCINVSDAIRIIDIFRKMNGTEKIVLIINTVGGELAAAEMIINAIQEHIKSGGTVTAYIPNYAFSGGALIALSCTSIIMEKLAIMGPMDPQISIASFISLPAASIVAAINKKQNKTGDLMEVLSDNSAKAMDRINQIMNKILADKNMTDDVKQKIKEYFSSGIMNHDKAITVSELISIGLNVSTDYPKELFDLFTY